MKRIAVIVLALVACVGLAFATASAFNPADLQRLEATGRCVDCGLSGAVLIHWKLRGADLAGANLFRAKLGASNLLFMDSSDAIWVDGSRCERPSPGWCKR